MIECSAHTRRTFYGKCNTLANESDAQRIVRANPRSPNRLLDFPLWALAVLREPFPPPHLLTTAPLTNCVSTPANTLSSSANTLSAQTNTLATLRNTLFPPANTREMTANMVSTAENLVHNVCKLTRSGSRLTRDATQLAPTVDRPSPPSLAETMRRAESIVRSSAIRCRWPWF